jgi:hypothetical protein
MYVYGMLFFILGIIVAYIDDIIYFCVVAFIGTIIIDIIFDVYVMKNVIIVGCEGETSMKNE